MTEIQDMKQQLMELQSQMAFQEDALRELNDALALQQRELLVLQRQLKLIKQHQDEQTVAQVPGSLQEKPPHY